MIHELTGKGSKSKQLQIHRSTGMGQEKGAGMQAGPALGSGGWKAKAQSNIEIWEQDNSGEGLGQERSGGGDGDRGAK